MEVTQRRNKGSKMKHNKIKKEIQVELAKLAIQLPITYREITVQRGILGEALLMKGMTETKSGEKIVSKQIYVVPITDKVAINNRKRLFDLYRKDGIEAVKSYVKGVLELSSENHVGQSFGGLVMSKE